MATYFLGGYRFYPTNEIVQMKIKIAATLKKV